MGRNQRIPAEYANEFNQVIYSQSAVGLKVMLLILAVTQFAQLVIYSVSDNVIYKDPQLIILKAVALTLALLYLFMLNLAMRQGHWLHDKTVFIIALSAISILVWAIFNTFKAQSITSDISIYLMILLAISAVIRLKPSLIAVIYIIGYGLLAVGLPYYQTNPEYLIAHRINSFIFTVIAFAFSMLLYGYKKTDFLDKLEIRLKNRELLYLSQHDGLTSLYNHQAIYDLLETTLKSTEMSNHNVSVLLLDLDYFKEINDDFGHNTGDVVLKRVSEIIKKTVGNQGQVGRYGGDEFIVVMTEGQEVAKQLAERLLEEVRALEFEAFRITFSCGIAQWRQESCVQLIDKADRALYRAKHQGKNQVNSVS